MQHLWAPWRMNYIKDVRDDCPKSEIFVKIAQSSDDEKNMVLQRGKTCFAVLNLFPYNTGHLMVIPYRQTGTLEELTEAETLEIFALLKAMKAALTRAFQPQGFNVGINLGSAAGAGIVEHLHVHLVPRWDHDANFMSVTADTRVHPSDLAGVYQQIKAALA
jgi:ATP adenylyltransferase